VSSIAGRITTPLIGAYHASKYAVEALSNALRLELAPFGINVILIEPGAIRTEFSDRAMSQVEKYRTSTSPYATIFEDVERIRRFFDIGAIGIEVVSRAIVRAVEAERLCCKKYQRNAGDAKSQFPVQLIRSLQTGWR
jgi:short-subunit dehydrogenase